VRRKELDVLVKLSAIELVLDSVVGKMNLVVEVRQIVFARPVTDLVLVATRAAVAVGATAVGLLQELLVLALQVLFEDDASDLKVRVAVSETDLFLSKRRVEIRVVVDLPGAADASVEHLGRLTVSLQRVRIEEVPPFCREGESTLAVAQVDQLDELLLVEVLKGVVRKIEIVFRHDPKRSDRGQHAAVFAVKLVDSIAVNDQFAFVAARQVEVAHQPVTGVVFIAGARVVDARLVVAAIWRVVFTWITPSGIGHRFLRCLLTAVWVVREDALAVPARGGSGRLRSAGTFRRAAFRTGS
jgi:hypothetical protein